MTRRAAEQGTELVGRLLAFARRQKLQPGAIDIGRLSATVTAIRTRVMELRCSAWLCMYLAQLHMLTVLNARPS